MAQLLNQSLDEIISQNRSEYRGQRRRGGSGGGGGHRRSNRGGGGGGGSYNNEGSSGPIRSRPSRRHSGGSAPYPTSRSDRENWKHDLYDDEDDFNPRRKSSVFSRLSDPYDGTKIVVRNLHYNVTNTDLKVLFGTFGQLKSVDIEYDRAGRSKGSAVAIFANREDAEAAIAEYNGKELDNQAMDMFIVERSHTPIRIGTSADGQRRVVVSSNRGGPNRFGNRGGFRDSRGGRGRGGDRRGKRTATREELDNDLTSYTTQGVQQMDINL